VNRRHPLDRRSFLAALAGLIAGACARPLARPQPPPTAALPEFERITQDARSIVLDALAALRTFDVFHAFRVSTAPDSPTRLSAELSWDPPASAAWGEATRVARGLYARADLLFAAATTARIDPTRWRERRALDDAVHDLFDLGSALGAYNDRLAVVGPGDASGARGLLDMAWARWDTAAARWALSRSEAQTCVAAVA
jgi:hypothetical protein